MGSTASMMIPQEIRFPDLLKIAPALTHGSKDKVDVAKLERIFRESKNDQGYVTRDKFIDLILEYGGSVEHRDMFIEARGDDQSTKNIGVSSKNEVDEETEPTYRFRNTPGYDKIRLLSYDDFNSYSSFPCFSDAGIADKTVAADQLDFETAYVVFISHVWLRPKADAPPKRRNSFGNGDARRTSWDVFPGVTRPDVPTAPTEQQQEQGNGNLVGNSNANVRNDLSVPTASSLARNAVTAGGDAASAVAAGKKKEKGGPNEKGGKDLIGKENDEEGSSKHTTSSQPEVISKPIQSANTTHAEPKDRQEANRSSSSPNHSPRHSPRHSPKHSPRHNSPSRSPQRSPRKGLSPRRRSSRPGSPSKDSRSAVGAEQYLMQEDAGQEVKQRPGPVVAPVFDPENGIGYPDNELNSQFKLCATGLRKLKYAHLGNFKNIYIWMDYCCLDLRPHMIGSTLNDLDLGKIMSCCDCLFTPLYDTDIEWEFPAEITHFYEDYDPAPWKSGSHAYMNRAWCRMEMFFGKNVPILKDVDDANIYKVSDDQGRVAINFAQMQTLLRSHTEKHVNPLSNFDLNQSRHPHSRRAKMSHCLQNRAFCEQRPHILYGTYEARMGLPPMIRPPISNDYIDKFAPLAGHSSRHTDRTDDSVLKRLIRDLEQCMSLPKFGYEGDVDEDGKMHGRGTYIYENGESYVGDWEHGKKQGVGVFKHSNGDVFDGEFSDDLEKGLCTFRYQNGDTYFGQLRHGRKYGEGVIEYKNGDVYEGNFRNDKRQGQGVMRYANGDMYIGHFKHDERQGFGALTNKSEKTVFAGYWRHDKPDPDQKPSDNKKQDKHHHHHHHHHHHEDTGGKSEQHDRDGEGEKVGEGSSEHENTTTNQIQAETARAQAHDDDNDGHDDDEDERGDQFANGEEDGSYTLAVHEKKMFRVKSFKNSKSFHIKLPKGNEEVETHSPDGEGGSSAGGGSKGKGTKHPKNTHVAARSSSSSSSDAAKDGTGHSSTTAAATAAIAAAGGGDSGVGEGSVGTHSTTTGSCDGKKKHSKHGTKKHGNDSSPSAADKPIASDTSLSLQTSQSHPTLG